MSFNYKWFKKTAAILPNHRVFNRFFKSGELDEDEAGFTGLDLTHKLARKTRDYVGSIGGVKESERLYRVYSITNNVHVLLITFLPILIGGTASLACALAAVFAITSSEIDYPWIFLGVTVAWNFNFLFNLIFSRFKGAYIDRQAQTLSFRWRVKGNPPKNEFGTISGYGRQVGIISSSHGLESERIIPRVN